MTSITYDLETKTIVGYMSSDDTLPFESLSNTSAEISLEGVQNAKLVLQRVEAQLQDFTDRVTKHDPPVRQKRRRRRRRKVAKKAVQK